ncbi:MAG: lipopolysaccharide biosynthesis protein [Burkholderiaceae bacterium]|nr:lipopolysaccharide biosynthesis protein [Burkholderiaceae bacterium]
MSENHRAVHGLADVEDEPGMTFSEMLSALRRRALLLAIAPLVAGAAMAVYTGTLSPVYTASTTFMPPQQTQSGLAAALASLGPLAALAGAGGGQGGSVDRYVSLMQSNAVSDRIIDHFALMDVYKAKLRVDARGGLAGQVKITVGKKDGLIKVEVDDTIPQRAADIANRYVVELRTLLGSLAVTEAQQRRVFFEQQLERTRDGLIQAQQALQATGFSAGALKTEPRAAADAYARLKAEVTTAEVRLQTLRESRADGSPEVLRQQSEFAALRGQLARLEQTIDLSGGPDYVSKYREFKYQETLFELYARQFELARVDESRQGTLVQVVDMASPPERKSKPKRALMSLVSALVTLVGLTVIVLVRQGYGQSSGGAAGRRIEDRTQA